MPETAPIASDYLASAFAALDMAHSGAPRDRYDDAARIQRDADALPKLGPVADLVRALGAELHRLVTREALPHEAAPYLRPFGIEAYRLTGSVRAIRAVCQAAAGLDPRRAEVRRDLIDKAWDRIGGPSGTWMA